MVRKLTAAAASVALLLSAAVPAFAVLPSDWDVALVSNKSVAVSNTGGNSQSNWQSNTAWKGGTAGGGTTQNMTTGGAGSYSGAVVVANTHVGCGCDSDGDGHVDLALVRNRSYAVSNSGLNSQSNGQINTAWKGGTAGGGTTQNMTTGLALSESHAWTVVNTHASFSF